MRLAVHPQGGLAVDLAGRLPGRGLYVEPVRAQVRVLLKRHRHAPEEAEAFLSRLEGQLAQRLVEGIGLARRAGALRRGMAEAEKAVAAVGGESAGGDMLLLMAADIAGHTREKAERLASRHGLEAPLAVLDRERFGAVCGGGLVAVLLVLGPGLCRRVGNDARRWLEYTVS